MVAEKFQIYSVKITANTFESQKIESVHFYSCPSSKTFSHRYPPGRQELPIPPEQRFLKIFFPEQNKTRGEGGGIMELKKLPKLTRESVTHFEKFHHLCKLHIFGLCFDVQ